MADMTREAGLEQLQNFLPHMGKAYASKRNFDYGPDAHLSVSRLSGFLRRRLITESEVLNKAMSAHSFTAAEKFIQEIFWRTYFKGWLEMRPTIWMEWSQAKRPDHTHPAYEAAINGRTGIACFDHWVEELRETHYLHNHARMWFASIWIFTLGLPWQWGAHFFYTQLLDADPASNTCSWRWVAGLHTKGKHYVARAQNIADFTAGRFAPHGQLNEQAEAVDGADNPIAAAIDWPDAIEDGPYILCVTAEDGHLETLPLRQAPVCVLALPAHLGAYSDQADALITADQKAINDAVRRVAAHYNVDSVLFDGPADADLAYIGHWVMQQSDARQTKQLVVAQMSAGVWRDRLSVLQAQWRGDGIELGQVGRAYDRLCWPYAKKGFFPFKEKIPLILSSL